MTTRAFFTPRPLFWGAFTAVVLAIPITAAILESRMTFTEILPTINACLNGTSALLLFAGWRAIRARRIELHRGLMLGAVSASVLFLIFYLTRFALTGAHRYPLHDWSRPVYLAVLTSHTLLAASLPVLVPITLLRARRKDFVRHRRLARVTFPIWAYVSVTGVIVYLMLYHLAA